MSEKKERMEDNFEILGLSILLNIRKIIQTNWHFMLQKSLVMKFSVIKKGERKN